MALNNPRTTWKIGQTTRAKSMPVVLPSDQDPIPVTGGGTDPVGLKNIAQDAINPATEDTLALLAALIATYGGIEGIKAHIVGISDLFSYLYDALGNIVNPATADKQDDIISAIEAIPPGGSDPVGLKDIADAPINPAKEDGNLAAIAASLDTVETKLQSVIDSMDGLEGFTDGIEGLLTTLGGYVDQLEGYVDGIEGYVDTVETELAAIQTAVELIDDVVGAIKGPGSPTIDSYTQKPINLAAGANQSLVTAPGASKQIWVYGIMFSVNVAGTVSFQDEDDTALTGIMQIAATGGMSVAPSGNFAMPLWKVATNKALEVDVVTSELDGLLTYAIVSV